ncbi:bifunctional lysylphosphatidylglycerol flippase/synthetase MprF [Nocardia arizonensis]|uniref:bifunctional lysylphosphatidylglycerol flippase/synthetase MprF n=1 Tax=Nocardia arizonensis TaxID=1141647 RepID=UPI0009EB6A9E|nr:phosphatidylglycerol lysyltransferase domain-containing protein [Nocardia arizonensis]
MPEQRKAAVRVTAGHRQMAVTAAPAIRPVLTVALLLLCAALLYAANEAAHQGVHRGWFVAVSISTLFVVRGLHLCRPITLQHVAAAVLVLGCANVAYRTGHSVAGFVFLAATGYVLMLPRGSRPQPDLRYRVAELVGRTEGDALAPFALHSTKSYFFDADCSAAIGYRTRFGIAVVAGDPIGTRAIFPQLVTAFSEFAAEQGWRIAVLGAGPEVAPLWQRHAGEHRGLRPIPIGRDVVLEVEKFAMVGRDFRNLRQAVNRTVNSGVTTEITAESALTEPLRAELLDIVDEWRSGRQNRGFSMILDHLLNGRNPGMLLVLARDESGRVAGFQRYGMSARGSELSLDVPWRRKDAPNGLDERMIVDLVDHAKRNGIMRISLAFAAFPELFADKNRTGMATLAYHLVHLGDPLIRLESLYRFLRKFHALGDQRFVLIRRRDLVPAAAALLTLEFVPHRKQY